MKRPTDDMLPLIEEFTGHDKRPDPVKALFWILLAAILAFFALGLSACSVTVSSDGSKSATVDGAALLEIIKAK